jgi:hypothetical protein
VIFEDGLTLPEGTPVSVVCRAAPLIRVSKRPKRVSFPLVPSSNPGSLLLTGEMIAEILDDEDMSS